MLQVAGDAPLATDTNLLPEVRLAGLLTNPTGEAAPVPALRRGGRFDILPYLEPSVQSQWLQQLVLGLHSSGDRKTAQRAWAQLAQIDPKGAANLRRLLLPRRRR
jgi:hypothetical protein